MCLSAQSMEVLISQMPTLVVYRPPWYPSWHPGDLTVTYHSQGADAEPEAVLSDFGQSGC